MPLVNFKVAPASNLDAGMVQRESSNAPSRAGQVLRRSLQISNGLMDIEAFHSDVRRVVDLHLCGCSRCFSSFSSGIDEDVCR